MTHQWRTKIAECPFCEICRARNRSRSAPDTAAAVSFGAVSRSDRDRTTGAPGRRSRCGGGDRAGSCDRVVLAARIVVPNSHGCDRGKGSSSSTIGEILAVRIASRKPPAAISVRRPRRRSRHTLSPYHLCAIIRNHGFLFSGHGRGCRDHHRGRDRILDHSWSAAGLVMMQHGDHRLPLRPEKRPP